ncbi:HD domain-containing protein [Exiguobacterium sp. SH3S2]|uniref:HD domain-containing protein n=1 Tax=unclassified Exiguobacterium TaxID=2644629 RepID=UPI00103E2A66|nr:MULTISPECIES: HD domain-containing protein [unclassified Exiguobacterium]TCI46464.1 HD domain-containing protein [Exiguobacterium sp. SH3S3]TCI62106.1 HD domain-containing protein [Exiguobacterium sp. SH3S2]
MTRQAIQATERFVTKLHTGDHTGHDMSHLERVRRLAEHLAEGMAVDPLVVTLAALLHDVEDAKLGRAKGLVRHHLETIALSTSQTDHVLAVIAETSFSQGRLPTTLESAIIQDADRLDAIGAIGIARTFQYAGSRGTPLYDPDDPSSAIAHFSDKLLLLADGMHTDRAKAIARDRHAFMTSFLKRFEAEWVGEDM